MTLIGERISATYEYGRLRVTPRTGRADRFVLLPGGAQFQCPDVVELDRLPQESAGEGPVSWLEARWPVALVALVITAALLALGYRFGLPALARWLAPKMPYTMERNLGEGAIRAMDQSRLLQPSRVSDDTQFEIRQRFARMVAGRDGPVQPRVEFRALANVPNALAFPGGTIVLTDGMVQMAESYEEVLAVLAHEVGHVERRHTLLKLIEESAVTMVVATVLGDASGGTVGAAVVPAMLLNAAYSRQAESDADDFAFHLLRQNGVSPSHFADILRRLEQRMGGRVSVGFLSSHPGTPERIEAARKAALQQ